MSERYFAGLDFKEKEPSRSFEIITLPYELVDIPATSIETSNLDKITLDLGELIIDDKIKIWTPDQIIEEFSRQLAVIEREVNRPRLTMRGITIKFVTPLEMKPQNARRKLWLVQNYGTYIADGGDGDCSRNNDGSFFLRIGVAGQEHTRSKDDVLELMAHEFGHTLGKVLKPVTFEELKAYAFANLFMRYYYNVHEYRVYPMDVSNPHDTALYWLEQLLEQGISEEAILSHLIGKKFAMCSPYDYLNMISHQ